MKFFLALVGFFVFGFAFSQTEEVKPVNEINPYAIEIFIPQPSLDSLKEVYEIRSRPKKSLWKKLNRFGLDVSEVAFVNWNAGGSNSISALFNANIQRIYETANVRWNNELLLFYGINKQEEQELRKTDDNFEINSTYGYRKDTLSNWYYSAKMNFTTQLSNGYNYPDTETEISTLLAPAYFLAGIGAEYGANQENFSMYASPLTVKSTFVLDQELANSGAFGVTPAVYDDEGNLIREGEKTRLEVGFLLTNQFTAQIFDNIALVNRLSLYTDYLNNFGNIDVNWELNFNFRVNQFVMAKLGSHIKYDDDIKIQEENSEGELIDGGPKIQWKQQLGIGVIVEL